MSPPDVYPEGIPFTDARPPQDNGDRLQDDSYLMSAPGQITVTNGTYPVYANGQNAPQGAVSPQDVIVSPIPSNTPPANLIQDDITLRTGPVFAPTVPYIAGTGPSPGPVPGSSPPQPPFYTE